MEEHGGTHLYEGHGTPLHDGHGSHSSHHDHGRHQHNRHVDGTVNHGSDSSYADTASQPVVVAHLPAPTIHHENAPKPLLSSPPPSTLKRKDADLLGIFNVIDFDEPKESPGPTKPKTSVTRPSSGPKSTPKGNSKTTSRFQDASSSNPSVKSSRQNRSILDKSQKEFTYCFCQRPDDGSPMIFCNKCKIWYHCACVNINLSDFERIGNDDCDWFCQECVSKSQNTQQLNISCPHCPLDLHHKTYKGEKGLRRHIKSAHKDLLPTPQEDSQKTIILEDPFHVTLSQARRNVKLLRQIPKGARMFAAEKLATLINTAVEKNDVDSWRALFLYSYSSLGTPTKKEGASLTSLVKQNIKNGVINLTTEKRKIKTSLLAKRIEEKVSDGDIKNAMRLLTSDDTLAPENDNTFEALLTKHPSPSRTLFLPDAPNGSLSAQIDQSSVLKALSKYNKGSAAGMDGIKPIYLKDMTSKHCGASGKRLLSALTNLVNFLLAGKLNENMCEFMYGAVLVALKKKDGGIRPIAVGNTFRRLAEKLGAEAVSKNISRTYLWPRQVGVSVSGGCEAAVHCTRKYLNEITSPSKVLLKIDYKNAFNSVERDNILNEVKSKTPELFPLLWQAYSKPSILLYGSKVISSSVGCQQGCPAGCLGFSLALHPVVESLSSEFVVFYLDDGTIGGNFESVLEDFKKLMNDSKNLGLEVNPSKCEIFIPNGEMKEEILLQFREIAPGIKLLAEDELTLLGSPLTEAAARHVLKNKSDLYRLLSQRLKTLNPHTGLYLLKNCLAVPKMMFLLRTAPLWNMNILEDYDLIVRDSLECLLNCVLNDSSWTQATLPVAFGGIGIRKLKDLAIPAYCSSVFAAQNLAKSIINSSLIENNETLNEAQNLWKISSNSDIPTVPHIQKNWDLPIITSIYDDLPRTDEKTQARLLSVSKKESGDWLNAVPSPQLGTLLDPESLRISVALRLGIKIYSDHDCVCGKKSDEYGHHALACTKSAGRSSRHHAINDLIKRALLSADIPSILEPLGIDRDDGKRVDGITLIPWTKGKQLTWDATCVDPLCDSYLSASCREGASAANAAVKKKHLKYVSVKDRFYFIAFAVDCFGAWSDEALKFGLELGTKMASSTGEPRSFTYFRQRISIAIQRGNASSVYGTIPKDMALGELFYL